MESYAWHNTLTLKNLYNLVTYTINLTNDQSVTPGLFQSEDQSQLQDENRTVNRRKNPQVHRVSRVVGLVG